MFKFFEKASLVSAGIVILAVALFNPLGCVSNKKSQSPPTAPTQDIRELGQDVARTGSDLKTTTETIKNNATDGMKATPVPVQPLLNPYWTNILTATGVQEQLVKNLESATQRAKEAEEKSKKFESDFNSERTARLKAEDSTTKELKQKYLAYSGVLFLASLVLFGIAVWNGGNKILLWGGTIAGVGSAICIFIVQTVALIPWIVGGCSLVAIGFLVYSLWFKEKKITTLDTATKELVETVEATKPRMTMAGRAKVFGDGPGKGDAYSIQSPPTEEIVKAIRKTIETAPKLPATVATDWNGDGIVDDNDISPIEVVTSTSIVPQQKSTRSRKRVLR